MKVLYITQEYAPFFADGGLGVTAAALPAALHEHQAFEHDIILPYYPRLISRLGLRTEELAVLPRRDIAGIRSAATIHRLIDHDERCEILLVRADAWYDRYGIYRDEKYQAFADEAHRAAYFGWCVADWVAQGTRDYGLVHGTDHQSGPAMAHLRDRFPRLPQLLSVFNGLYQGDLRALDTATLCLPQGQHQRLSRTSSGRPSLLLIGLLAADAAVTCSPGYARELRIPADGDPIPAALSRVRLAPVQLGVDQQQWDPSAPGRVSVPFGAQTVEAGKQANKLALQKHLGLDQDGSSPVIGICSRLVPEKGTDLLLTALEPMLRGGRLQLALIGPATAEYESGLRALSDAAPGRLVHLPLYDQAAAWLAFAGADFTVMPSRVEPGGFNQLIAYRYGTIPIVSPVGGLADTVVDLYRDPSGGTGFHIAEHTAHSVAEAVARALDWMAEDPDRLTAVRRRIMALNWSWARTAENYARVYERLLSPHEQDEARGR